MKIPLITDRIILVMDNKTIHLLSCCLVVFLKRS